MRYAAALLAAAAVVPAEAAAGTHWVTTWGASTQPDSRRTLTELTIRQVVKISVGGSKVRLRISNAFGGYAPTGDTALRVGSVYVGRQAGATAAVVPGTQTRVTFGGSPSVRVAAGSDVVSDPVPLAVTDGDTLAVSIYVPGTTPNASFHSGARQRSYMTPAGGGDRSAQTDATGFTAITNSWWYLDAVSVQTSDRIGAVVALGDSITEGANSTPNTNRRWPDLLAARLNAVGNPVGVRGVVNAGISGNAVIRDFGCCGGNPSGLSRLDRDVLSHDGVRTVIVALGINGIGNYPNETVSVPDITDGLRQIADRLHRGGKRVLMATLTPFAVATLPGYYSLEKDAKRIAVNQYIRSAPHWDGIVDFERALADPADPLRMLPAYDSGDHLHPNDAGMQALANAVTWLDDPSLPIDKPATSVGGAVPATLSLTLGPAPTFGAFVPGVAREYAAQTSATVTSTAESASLSVGEPGRLANGAYALTQPLQVAIAPAAWSTPVANAAAAITFKQAIAADEPLRTGVYSRTLVFTLATTSP
jgi:lysophospholipase L1-like esterase